MKKQPKHRILVNTGCCCAGWSACCPPARPGQYHRARTAGQCGAGEPQANGRVARPTDVWHRRLLQTSSGGAYARGPADGSVTGCGCQAGSATAGLGQRPANAGRFSLFSVCKVGFAQPNGRCHSDRQTPSSSLQAGVVPAAAAWGLHPQPHTVTAAHPLLGDGGGERQCLQHKVCRAASSAFPEQI